MTTQLSCTKQLSHLVVLHGPEDQDHFTTFAHALYGQPRGARLRIIPVCQRGRLLGLQSTIVELVLRHADAVVFLSKPRNHEQLRLAHAAGERAVVFQASDKRAPGLVQLASRILDRLFPPRPIQDVLCMFACPTEHEQLALHREWRMIEDVNNRASKPLAIKTRWAASVHDLQDAVLDQSWDLVHFSGHGEPGSVYFETADGNSQSVATPTLVKWLADHQPRCLVFNACHSAEMLTPVLDRVPHVIAMQGTTTDDAAIEFSRAFYAALARGRSVEQAFGHAFGGLGLHGHSEHCRPRLLN